MHINTFLGNKCIAITFMALNEHLVSDEWVKLKTTKFNFNITGAICCPESRLMVV